MPFTTFVPNLGCKGQNCSLAILVFLCDVTLNSSSCHALILLHESLSWYLTFLSLRPPSVFPSHTHKHFQECASFFAGRLQGQRWRLSSEVDSDLSLLSQLLKRSGKRSTKSYSEGGTACNASPEWPSEDDASVAGCLSRALKCRKCCLKIFPLRLKSLLKKTPKSFLYYSTYTKMSVSCN